MAEKTSNGDLQIMPFFTELRNHEFSSEEEDSLKLLERLAVEINNIDGFILGSYVFWDGVDSSVPTLYEIDGKGLFFHTNAQDNFKDKALKTLQELQKNGGKLFISKKLHQLDKVRAKKIELLHHDCRADCTTNCCDSMREQAWFVYTLLSRLGDLFSNEDDKTTANEYQNVIKGYFPTNDRAYTIIYCPFLVPDGKPPGNFFGVFECNGNCNDDLLRHLSKIQLIGTLVFSKKAVSALVEEKMSKKYDELKEQINKIRELREPFQRLNETIGVIEGIMNPYDLWLGAEPMQAVIDQLGKSSRGYFRDGLHEASAYSSSDINELCKEWNEAGGLGNLKLQLKQAGDGVYKKYFGCFSVGAGGYNTSSPFIAKALNRKCCPLLWIDDLIEGHCAEMCETVVLGEDINPLAFTFALRTLKETLNNGVETQIKIMDGQLVVKFTVSKRGGHFSDNLRKLYETVLEKSNNVSEFNLSREQTSSALALLGTAAIGSLEESVLETKEAPEDNATIDYYIFTYEISTIS